MFDGISPYEKSTCESETIFRIMKKDIPLPKRKISDEFLEFLEGCLNHDSQK